jgi:hypothetical protein
VRNRVAEVGDKRPARLPGGSNGFAAAALSVQAGSLANTSKLTFAGLAVEGGAFESWQAFEENRFSGSTVEGTYNNQHIQMHRPFDVSTAGHAWRPAVLVSRL